MDVGSSATRTGRGMGTEEGLAKMAVEGKQTEVKMIGKGDVSR